MREKKERTTNAEDEKQKWKPGLRFHYSFAFDAVFTKRLLPASIPIFNNIKNIGRHDWTRTNDPYHVKVVL